MSRFTYFARLSAIVAAALAMSLPSLVVPAQADDPAPKATRVSVAAFNELDDDTILGLAANVSPVAFISGNWGITGTVTFRDGDGTVLASGVPVAPDNGYAQAYIPKPTQPTTYFADFHATGAWVDSTSTGVLYTPYRFRTVIVTPEPTLLKVTSGSPQLTLTLSAYARFKDGTPAPGVTVYFSGDCLIPGPRMCQLMLQYCKAVTDWQGFASCKGAGTLGSVVSILGGSVWMSAHSSNRGYYVQVPDSRPPVIVTS